MRAWNSDRADPWRRQARRGDAASRSDAADADAGTDTEPPADLARTVLVVDDDPAAQGRLAEALVRAGYRLMQTTNARDVQRLARQYRPDAIVLELGLQDGSAPAVLHALRADSTTRHIPVLAVSGPGGLLPPDGDGAAGLVVALRKPLSRARLLAHVRDLLAHAPAAPEPAPPCLAEAPTTPAAPEPAPPSLTGTPAAPAAPRPLDARARQVAQATWLRLADATSRLAHRLAWRPTRLHVEVDISLGLDG